MENTKEKNNIIVLVGSDHGGYELKEKLKKYILYSNKYSNLKLIDIGTDSTDRTDYPIYAKILGKKLVEIEQENIKNNGNEKVFGILICKSGHGMTVAANKVRGVRASLVNNEEGIKNGIADDALNVFCIASNDNDIADLEKYFDILLNTSFKNESNYIKRLEQIEKMEEEFNF